jgi:hypothetical protein
MWDCKKCGKSNYNDNTWCFSCRTPKLDKNDLEYGVLNPKLVCPHCQTAGNVRAKTVKLKKGISGGKVTGAILTGGLSMLATGLSRKKTATQAHCDNSGSTWLF